MIVKFKRLHPGAILPKYQTEGASGMDLHWDGGVGKGSIAFARRQTKGYIITEPLLFGTGLAAEIPEGYEGQIRPRSSLGKFGIHCYLGTIDCDYRGELRVRLQLLGGAPDDNHPIRVGDRIAQLVIAPVSRVTIEEASELSHTERGGSGFGSTGK